MDMRQLIAQIDHIENKQILNEDAHYTTAQVDNRPRVSKSNNQTSIYEMLIKEFGYDLGEETLDEVAFSPEQQAKMGQANPQDPYIVARVLGKTAVPLSHFTDPADQAIAKQLGFKDGPAVAPAAPAAPAGTAAQPAATVDAGATDMSMGQAGAVNAADATAGATDMSMGQAGAVNAADTAAGATDMSLGQAGAVNAAAPAVTKPPGTAAQPAANKSMTPAITAYASRMGLLKNNKPDVAAIKKFQQDNGLKADGIIGPNTAGAILSAQKPGAGGRGGPTAAQAAQATPATKPAGAPATTPAGSGAQPAAPVDPTKLSVSQRIATQPSIIDQGREKLGIPAGGTSPTKEDSVRSQDDAILERIRTALFR